MFLSARLQFGSVSRLLRLNAAARPITDVAGIENEHRQPEIAGAIGLFEANHPLLSGPVEREVNMRSEFQISQFSTLGDRLNDFGREKRQPDQAGDVAISNALAARDRGQRSRPARDEFLEPPMGPCNRFQQSSIRLARRGACASDYESQLHASALHPQRNGARHR